jgi:hypothetical protein
MALAQSSSVEARAASLMPEKIPLEAQSQPETVTEKRDAGLKSLDHCTLIKSLFWSHLANCITSAPQIKADFLPGVMHLDNI